MRDDLKLAAYAVANGFAIGLDRGRMFSPGAFDAVGIPHDGLTFERGGVHVWNTARGWRVARIEGDRFPPVKPSDFHATLIKALQTALALDTPAPAEWSGSPCPLDPENFWIDDETGERVNAATGERTPAETCKHCGEPREDWNSTLWLCGPCNGLNESATSLHG